MGRLKGVVLLLVMTMCMGAQTWAYGDIIESTAVYPDYATAGDYFTVCILIKQSNPCIEDTLDVDYAYIKNYNTYLTGSLQPFEEYIRDNHFKIDDVPNDRIWCASIKAIADYDYLEFSASCRDHLDNTHTDFDDDYLEVGDIFINTTSEFADSRLYSVRVEEDMEIELYVDGYSDIDIRYSVYNISLGTPYIQYQPLSKVEGQYRGDFEIPADAPTGFIEIFTTDQPYGGKFVAYAAVPFDAEISINNNTHMGKSVDIELDIDNYYGDIRSIVSYIVMPNGTSERIYLDNENTSTQYTIPTLPGEYSVECHINHSMSEDDIAIEYFDVPEYDVDIDHGRSAYYQGDKVDIELGLLNSDKEPVGFEFTMRIISPDSGSNTYDENDATLDENYYKLSITLDDDADLGEYQIRVDAEDEYGNDYEGNASFIVNEKDTSIVFRAEPESLNLTVETLDAVEYVITLYNDGDDDIEDIDIELDDEDLEDYVSFDTDNLSDVIEVDESSEFTVIITPTEDMDNDVYETDINVISDNVVYEIPLSIEISLCAKIEVEPSIDASILADTEGEIHITVTNPGAMNAEEITAEVSGDIEEYINDISTIEEIYPGDSDQITISLEPISDVGTYEGTIDITSDNAGDETISLTIEVIEDFKDEIGDIESKKKELDELYQKLEDSVSDNLKEDLDELQESIDEINDLYDTGDYALAYSKLSKAQNEAANIEDALSDIGEEEAEEEPADDCGNGICDFSENEYNCPLDCEGDDDDSTCNYDSKCQSDTEDCDCEDCIDDDYCTGGSGGGSNTMLIIFIVVIVVVIVVVVATSVVPDDYDQQYGSKR